MDINCSCSYVYCLGINWHYFLKMYVPRTCVKSSVFHTAYLFICGVCPLLNVFMSIAAQMMMKKMVMSTTVMDQGLCVFVASLLIYFCLNGHI